MRHMSHEHNITSTLDNAKQRCAVRVSHRVCYTNLILVMRLTYPAHRARCQELSLERVAKNIGALSVFSVLRSRGPFPFRTWTSLHLGTGSRHRHVTEWCGWTWLSHRKWKCLIKMTGQGDNVSLAYLSKSIPADEQIRHTPWKVFHTLLYACYTN